jgi:hypothetical protein
VSGVPHVLLIDGNGKIAFAGHPASRKLEEDLNDLAEGKPLTGAGTGAAEGGSSGPDFTGYTDMDKVVIDGECDAFEKGVLQFVSNADLK